ncbi:MAG TPA: prepilin-type N-terminal cleavage/methylation domain-containing protein [Candidatus Coprovivens excrementavium]|nr:prepilin-type N-terminal cleavage/methylation domain-containing protein [Candidatus Coprovivens excrementavium]
MKKNGYTALEMLIVIIVLGVFTIGILSTTSYAFKDKSESYYNETVHLIERQAALYGETLNNLKTEGNLIITLSDLIEKGYYIADDDAGNVIDPRNSNATLNGLKIKLTYEEDSTITAVVIEDE